MKIKNLLGSIFVAGGLTVACSNANQSVSRTEDLQLPNEYSQKFDNATVTEKEEILRKAEAGTYRGNRTLKIIPFTYDYPWKGSNNYGKVNVGIEGGVGAYLESRDFPSTGFEIQSWLDDGLKMPEGYSILRVFNTSDVSRIPSLVNGIERYGRENPELKIDDKDIEGLKKGLKEAGFYPK